MRFQDSRPLLLRIRLESTERLRELTAEVKDRFMMRAYIRHPADVPIHFTSIADEANDEKTFAQNISLGGLSFSCKNRLPVGSLVRLRIDVVEPAFEAKAKVVWCLSRPDKFEAGIEFVDEKDAFTARMVEQICHIEHYRIWVKEVEGREIDGESAAKEWIDKFAEDFPSIADPA